MVNESDPARTGEALRKANAALREALGRMDTAWAGSDRDHFFASSLEAAMWIAALNDFLRHGDDTTYDQRRDADPGGRIVRGLVWVRNNGVHGLIDVHEVKGGMTLPLRFPMRFEHASWKHRYDVDGAKDQGNNEGPYDTYVAGNVVQNTLREAQDFLWMRAVEVSPEGTDLRF